MSAQTKALEQSQGIVWERSAAYQITLRQKVKTGQILKRLVLHALGKVEMTATQVQAARILLGKTMPDLQAIAVSVEQDKPVSKGDIDAMLLAAGLEPDNEWNGGVIEGESVPNTGHAETENDTAQNLRNERKQ